MMFPQADPGRHFRSKWPQKSRQLDLKNRPAKARKHFACLVSNKLFPGGVRVRVRNRWGHEGGKKGGGKWTQTAEMGKKWIKKVNKTKSAVTSTTITTTIRWLQLSRQVRERSWKQDRR
jgi:hypothetical protein